MSSNGTQDSLLRICQKLLQIDNRRDADIAEVTGLSAGTISKLRKGDRTFIRSTTVAVVARSLHKRIVIR